MIRVVLADDHNLVRQGIRALLDRAEDITVIGEAADGQEAVELTESLAPDVLVMDIGMPRLNGIQAAEQLQSLGLATQIVILSMHSDEILVRQSLQCGARGYLLKRAVMDELLLAVRAATKGEIYLSPSISHSVVAGFLQRWDDMPSKLDRLTPREHEVLQLVSEGHTNTAIANLLQISVKTVEKHRANVMSKLGVSDVASLMRVAIKHRLILLDD